MIKINLIAERKAPRGRPAPVRVLEGARSRNLALFGIVLAAILLSGLWYSSKARQLEYWKHKNEQDRAELARLEEVRKKGEYYKARKALLERQIQLITELKRRQSVPVHVLDQISRNLPDFLWLESMTASGEQITLQGKATTYNAVSSFYNNLRDSGYFADVDLVRAGEEGDVVSFGLRCRYTGRASSAGASEAPAGAPGA